MDPSNAPSCPGPRGARSIASTNSACGLRPSYFLRNPYPIWTRQRKLNFFCRRPASAFLAIPLPRSAAWADARRSLRESLPGIPAEAASALLDFASADFDHGLHPSNAPSNAQIPIRLAVQVSAQLPSEAQQLSGVPQGAREHGPATFTSSATAFFETAVAIEVTSAGISR